MRVRRNHGDLAALTSFATCRFDHDLATQDLVHFLFKQTL